MSNKKTSRTYRYKATPDVLLLFILTFILFTVFFILIASGVETVDLIVPMFGIGSFLVIYLVDICIKSNSKRITISKDHITFNIGVFTRKTQTIHISQIRSHSKTVGILQGICNTSTICITTSGDAAEIRFKNMGNGDEAYKLITTLTKKNRDGT